MSESNQPSLSQARIVLVTGPSGAGRSTAIHVLEDCGYETIDNLPLSLLPRLLDGPPLGQPMALGIDTRNRDFSTESLIETIDTLTADVKVEIEVLYIDCRADVLLRRYSETRRRHPMAQAETPQKGIEREYDLLTPIKARADILIDTSEMSPHDLRTEIEKWLAPKGMQNLAVSVQSFSYKRGIPRSIDMIFDCRFLKNPYWDKKLRLLDGRDAGVSDYVQSDPRFDPFFDKVWDIVSFLLPAYRDEGKSHLSIGFGCTGGQHRSVMFAEKLALALAQSDWQVSIRHRELERRAAVAPAKIR